MNITKWRNHIFCCLIFSMRMLGMHSDAKVIGQAVANIWKMPKNKREIINFCSKWFSLICRCVVNNQQNVIPPMIFWINGDFNSHLNVSCHMDKAQFYNTHELFSLFAGFFVNFESHLVYKLLLFTFNNKGSHATDIYVKHFNGT